MPRKLFLSYSRSDDETGTVSDFARVLSREYRGLAGDGINIFIDTEAILPGMDWETKIRKEIERADLFIFALTPSSLRSEWCQKEVQLFAEKEHRITAERNWPAEVGLLFPVQFVELSHAILTEAEIRFRDRLLRRQVFDLQEFSAKRERDVKRVRLLAKQILTAASLPQISPRTAQSSGIEVNPAKVLDLDTSSRINGLIFGSFWDERNQFRELNLSILHSWGQQVAAHEGNSAHPFVHTATKAAFQQACDTFVEGISDATDRRKPIRFVTTNTSLDALGLSNWFEDDAIRFIMERTRDRTQKKGAACELWRVFVLKDPYEFSSSRHLGLFAAALRENIYSGIRTCIFSSEALPAKYSYSYSDFFCVPGQIASLSVSPYYLLAVFNNDNRDDAQVLSYYSDFADDLVRLSLDPNFSNAFEWLGDSEEELRELILEMIEADA